MAFSDWHGLRILTTAIVVLLSFKLASTMLMFGAQVIAEYERPLLFSRWGLSAPGLDYPTEPRATEAIDTLIYSVEELLWRLPAAADSEMGRRARPSHKCLGGG
jgi:hypothetical protein